MGVWYQLDEFFFFDLIEWLITSYNPKGPQGQKKNTQGLFL